MDIVFSGLFLTGFFLWAARLWLARRFVSGALLAGLGIWLVSYYRSVSVWFDGLGEDSLAEAQKFAWTEAWFFLKTLGSTFKPLHFGYLIVLVLAASVACLVIVLAARAWFSRRSGGSGAVRVAVTVLGALCILAPFVQQALKIGTRFKSNSSIYQGVQANFSGGEADIRLVGAGSDMRVILFIGESTTTMHWGMYGYPLDTTPGLSRLLTTDPGLLKFDDVVSTNAGTSPSLLEALSVGFKGENAFLPIAERRRASMVTLLKRLGIPTLLLSSQGATGTWNLASSIIFKDTDSTNYASPYAMFGTSATEGRDKVWDDVYFGDALKQFDWFSPQGPAVAFLHSYAGHGPYAANIPEWARHPADTLFQGGTFSSIYGSRLGDAGAVLGDSGLKERVKYLLSRYVNIENTINIHDYDNAMRYVDSVLAGLFEQVGRDPRPTVVLYFSDHGESPGSGIGHDPSRMEPEMIRIPFLMYFNEAARRRHAGLFDDYRAAARSGQPSTLAQLPATVMSLLGYDMEGDAHGFRGVGRDPETRLPPVVVRRVGTGTVYFRSHGEAARPVEGAEDVTKPASRIWLNSRQRRREAVPLCYGDANTWVKANRGALVADCLSVRLLEVDGILDAAPRAADAPGWTLNAVARVAASHGIPLWLDADGWPAGEACTRVQAWMAAQAAGTRPDLLLEVRADLQTAFPPACDALQKAGARVYLQVPEAVDTGTEAAAAWVRGLQDAGWPAAFSLAALPAPESLSPLWSPAGARWVLRRADVADLPWNPPAGMPPPDFIRMDTAWDINSR